jgi:hypothetical protein
VPAESAVKAVRRSSATFPAIREAPMYDAVRSGAAAQVIPTCVNQWRLKEAWLTAAKLRPSTSDGQK